MKLRLAITLLCILFFDVATAAVSLQQLEKNVHNQVNDHRLLNKKSPLKIDPLISGVCRKHAEQMAKGIVPFSHDSIQSRFNQIQKLVPKVISGAENIAWNKGYDNPDETAVHGWINSPSHHEAMLGEFGFTGIGAARSEDNRFYFNQTFIKCRKSRFK